MLLYVGDFLHLIGQKTGLRMLKLRKLYYWNTAKRKIAAPPKYEIQRLADSFTLDGFSIKILMLPVSHPELNPIELSWAYMKQEIR